MIGWKCEAFNYWNWTDKNSKLGRWKSIIAYYACISLLVEQAHHSTSYMLQCFKSRTRSWINQVSNLVRHMAKKVGIQTLEIQTLKNSNFGNSNYLTWESFQLEKCTQNAQFMDHVWKIQSIICSYHDWQLTVLNGTMLTCVPLLSPLTCFGPSRSLIDGLVSNKVKILTIKFN